MRLLRAWALKGHVDGFDEPCSVLSEFPGGSFKLTDAVVSMLSGYLEEAHLGQQQNPTKQAFRYDWAANVAEREITTSAHFFCNEKL